MSARRQEKRVATWEYGGQDLVAESWGLILRSGGRWGDVPARLAEVLLGSFGLALVLLAIGLWIVPGALLGPDLLGMKSALTTGLVMGGVLIWRFANQGLCTEIHLDRLRGEIRVVARNRAQRLRLLDCMTFADIDHVELEGADAVPGGSPARLVVHLHGSGERVLLASGAAVRLAPVRDLIDLDLSRARRVAGAPSGDLSRLICGII